MDKEALKNFLFIITVITTISLVSGFLNSFENKISEKVEAELISSLSHIGG